MTRARDRPVSSRARSRIVAIVVLFFFSIVLAAAETAFLRMSRVKAMALEEQGEKRASRLVRMLERPERTVNAVTLLALAAQLITSYLLGILLRRLGLVDRGAQPRAQRHRVLRVRRSRAEDVGGAAHRARRVAHVRVPALRHRLPADPHDRARAARPREHDPARQGLEEGPVRHRGGDPPDGGRRRRGSGDRDERARADPLDLRVRRHGRARGDGAATRHDRGRGRRDGRRGDRARRSARASRGSRRSTTAPTTSSGSCSSRTSSRAAPRARAASRCAAACGRRTTCPESKRVAELLREMQTEKFHMAIVRRRVRRHRRPRHDGGPARGDRRRDHRRVRRRGAAGRAARRTARCASPAAPRSTRSTSCSTSSSRQDEWDTVGGLVFNTLGHVPVEGECAALDRPRVLRRTGAGPPHRVGADPRARAARDPRRGRDRAASERARAAAAFRSGFVSIDRPAERREVDARQPARRAQGVDRLRRGRRRRARRSAACARRDGHQIVFLDTPGVHKPRTLLGERTNDRAVVDARRSRRHLLPRRSERRPSDRATGSSPSSSRRSRRRRPRREQGRRAPARTTSPSGSRPRPSSATSPPSCRLGAHRRRDRRARRASSRRRLPEGPHYYPDGVVTRSARVVPRRRARPREAARGRPRRAAALDRGHDRGDRGAGDGAAVRCSRCAWSCGSSASRRRAS